MRTRHFNFVEISAKILASGFGTGFSPIAPGTAGAAFAAIIWLFLQLSSSSFLKSNNFLLTLTVIFFVIGVWSAYKVEKSWGHDASKVVVDEMVGLWIAMWWIPYSWVTLLLAFILFRVFDIWKPLFIRKMEKLPHGWGVMLDDVLAGIYANLVLQAVLYLNLLP